MFNPIRPHVAAALATVLTISTISFAIACDGQAYRIGGVSAPADARDAGSSEVARDLATLRQATARFHEIAFADSIGYKAKITSCMADPALGGMGFHFGNGDLIDGALEVDKPEVLLYEPQANGRLAFVAVEYVVPYAAHARSAEAPKLFGQAFERNDRFQLWGLHVWVGKENPSGTFATWNPRVNCANTTDLDVAPM